MIGKEIWGSCAPPVRLVQFGGGVVWCGGAKVRHHHRRACGAVLVALGKSTHHHSRLYFTRSTYKIHQAPKRPKFKKIQENSAIRIIFAFWFLGPINHSVDITPSDQQKERSKIENIGESDRREAYGCQSLAQMATSTVSFYPNEADYKERFNNSRWALIFNALL